MKYIPMSLEVDLLIGDPTNAKENLGWVPHHDLNSLVKDMMRSRDY